MENTIENEIHFRLIFKVTFTERKIYLCNVIELTSAYKSYIAMQQKKGSYCFNTKQRISLKQKKKKKRKSCDTWGFCQLEQHTGIYILEVSKKVLYSCVRMA